MARRILVLSASVGAGHLRAAEAIELAARQLAPDATVRNVDILEFTNAAFRRVYAKTYLALANRAPHVLGYFYDLLDQPSKSGKYPSDRLRLLAEKLNLRRFMRFLQDDPWQLVINTHFLPAEIIASLRQKQQIDLPQVIATTDFETHRLWVNEPCEHYFTATEEGAHYLQHWGISPSRVTTTGIPIHPVFSEAKDRQSCLEKHGLAKDRPVVLQLAGGFGVGPIEKIYRALLDLDVPLQIVAITGRNEQAKAQLEAVPCPPLHRVKVVGFTHEIDEYLACADLVLTKPGGLTTSETLARGAVMAVLNPIPGQETRNSDFLLESGAAIKVNALGTLPYKLTALLRDPERLRQLKANAVRLARPRAAFDIVQHSLQFVCG